VSRLGFRHLSIGDLDEQTLRDLVAEGETLFVERKETDPSRGIGQTVAAFANTLGGWLLLGIADDGTLKGYEAGAGDFADKIRHKLRAQVEPLPPFSAATVNLDGFTIGLVRVFESADTPHIVLGTGSVPVREPAGTRNIESHAELIDLARRGERARADASERLESLPYLTEQIDKELPPDQHVLQGYTVRAAPFTRPADFADRVLSIDFGSFSRELARELFPGPPFAQPSHRQEDFSFGQRGFNVTSTQFGAHHRASVIADAGGAAACRSEQASPDPQRPAMLRPEQVAEEIKPLLTGVVKTLEKLASRGRVACDLLVRGFYGAHFTHQRAGFDVLETQLVHISGEITVPPDDGEIDALTHRWVNELARAAGLQVWQDLAN
jgi:hypothetical protein